MQNSAMLRFTGDSADQSYLTDVTSKDNVFIPSESPFYRKNKTKRKKMAVTGGGKGVVCLFVVALDGG